MTEGDEPVSRPPRPRAVTRSARLRLGALGVLLIAGGLVLLAYTVTASGAAAAIRDRWELLNWSPVSRGASLYQANCTGCHGGAGVGSLMDRPPRLNANGHAWQHGDCELLEVIRAGITPSFTSFHEGSPPPALTMPAWVGRLTDDDIRDVIAYVKTMWTDDQRVSQAALTRERCT